jgi:pimeloyl-ACP methyl ester carboxylesterase
MRYIDHGNIRIATQAFGNPEGPAVIMVMGATASMLLWPEALMQGLAAGGLHVIRFDHRDTGETTTVAPGAADHVVEDLAADVLAVLDAYGIARAHVVGMSLGGYIGQMLALTAPDRVASLTLVAAEPLGWDGDPLPHISDAFMAHFAGMAETRARRVLARTDSVASMFNHAALTTRDDWTGRFRDIARPVLVLHGIDDPVLPIENGRALAAGIPAARIVELAGVGHELPVRAIGQMVDTIAGFVAGQD